VVFQDVEEATMVLENIYGIHISFEKVYPPSNWSSTSERKFKHDVSDLIDVPEFALKFDTCFILGAISGIQFVKVGAYLTQELGFTNVSQLASGIIAYD
jgi:hypothetical protein